MFSLEDPEVFARGFKGQSCWDQSFCGLACTGTFYTVQTIEKATAPSALKLFFPSPLYGCVVFSLGVPSCLSFFFFSPPLELSDFALRVTAPLIVLAVSENGVLLAVCELPAAKCCQWDSRAFRSIDRAIMALFSTLSPSWGCV